MAKTAYSQQSPAPSMEVRWFKRAEAAEYLGVTQRTITSWVKERRIPFTRIGRSVRFDRLALDKQLESYTQQAFPRG